MAGAALHCSDGCTPGPNLAVMAKVMLLDGNSLAYRAFFALPTDMATASGQVTNAVFGFTSMLVNLLKDHKPDSIAVAFDRPEPTFRHELVVDYKAGRAETPDILKQQMGLVRQVVETLQLPLIEIVGFEADDIIATLAERAKNNGDDVIIVTGDRDVYQLVEDPHVKVLYNRRGVSDYVLYDEAGIKERTGVTPKQYVDYASMRGDPSDNLPGIPGVGEKTAAKLINQYGNLDGIFANVEAQTPKLRQNLTENEAQARSNARAIPLIRDVPLEVELDEMHMRPYDVDAAKQLFDFLEFRSLWDRLVEATTNVVNALPTAGNEQTFELSMTRIESPEELGDALDKLGEGDDPMAISPQWDGLPASSALLGLAFGHHSGNAVWLDASLLDDPVTIDALRSRLSGDAKRYFHAHRAKELMRVLAKHGVDADALGLDTAVAAYLVDPADSQYLLPELAARYAQLDLAPPGGPAPGQLDLDGTASDPAENTAREAVAIDIVAASLAEAMNARNLTNLWNEIERPLVRVLARMEDTGIRVDTAYLRTLTKHLTEDAARLDAEIQELAGEPFKVNSTQQLRTILFEKLGLAPQKKTKTGYSTDAASLEKLRGEHPIIEALLKYREVEKLRSTYGESLLAEVAPDDRIHATFQQTVARTGRLSSDRPNLHNIPIRSEEGKQFRRAFVPADDWKFLVADYNQIELRVIAHLAEDPGLIEAFESHQDIHTTTAARVFGVAPEDVTGAQRAKSKMVSYGLAYGMESYGLAQRLNIPVSEATEILDAYFLAFPNVRAYMDRTVEDARQKGYTETLFGRRRLIPELSSSNFRLRQAGERQAMNAGIQGLAADIFKVALVKLDRSLEDHALTSRIVLQVHDEIIVEVAPNENEQVEKLTLDAMNGATELRVPLEVNLAWGETWADAKG
jgi:DNA polymerase-1